MALCVDSFTIQSRKHRLERFPSGHCRYRQTGHVSRMLARRSIKELSASTGKALSSQRPRSIREVDKNRLSIVPAVMAEGGSPLYPPDTCRATYDIDTTPRGDC
jgi:hypothetical protein